ncbi:MAG: precorrin-3B C(17)-methyltransferase, partial [Nitrospirae bacterium]
KVSEPRYADIIITPKEDIYLDQRVCPTGGCRVKDQLYLRPKNLAIGIGFNRGTSSEEIAQAIKEVLKEENLSEKSVSVIASLDKKTEEEGFQKLVKELELPWVGFTVDELNQCVKDMGLQVSEYAEKATGALSVAEPSALLASGGGTLVVPKKPVGNVTVAVALMPPRKGKLYIVGVGPGSLDEITPRARQALLRSEVVVGYRAYVERLRGLLSGKDIYTTGMTKEIERCRLAIEKAREGSTVALVSSGDPGIYAMAGLVLELMKKEVSLRVPVEVIPGVSALNAVSARLGAPLMNDFAVISLSDRLTPWQTIEDRLRKAAEGDFVIVLFNPKSKGRPDHLRKALEIIGNYRPPDTPVGIVKA